MLDPVTSITDSGHALGAPHSAFPEMLCLPATLVSTAMETRGSFRKHPLVPGYDSAILGFEVCLGPEYQPNDALDQEHYGSVDSSG